MTVFVDYIEPLQRFTQRKLECLDVCYFSSTHTHIYTRNICYLTSLFFTLTFGIHEISSFWVVNARYLSII